jgi:ABC-type nickel/cobalt efflux system permease component RcnA
LRGPSLHGSVSVVYHDNNYKSRIGWKEIVVGAAARSRSEELRAYPQDLLRSPLDVTRAAARLTPGLGPSDPPPLEHAAALQAPDRVADSGFAALVARRHTSVLVVLAALAAALFWGAAHALSPGHGKTIVTAYLVGRRGTPAHAALLGLIVTATHTAGVFALGLVTLALSRFIVPEQLYPWLNLVSGIMVLAVGAAVLRTRLSEARHAHAHGAAQHDHHHHDHRAGRRGVVALGASAGLIPCPTALVVLLGAIAQHQVALGLVLIVAFSGGLAATLTALGVLVVRAARLPAPGRVASALPAVSAVAIVCVGLLLTVRALPGVLG